MPGIILNASCKLEAPVSSVIDFKLFSSEREKMERRFLQGNPNPFVGKRRKCRHPSFFLDRVHAYSFPPHQPRRLLFYAWFLGYQGNLKGYDHTINLVLEGCKERIYSQTRGVEQARPAVQATSK